jgi:hypothetical protein
MARPTLRHHRKFRHLARLLGDSPALAWGTLELVWHVAYECGDPLVGSAADVEDAACWRGKRGACAAALVEAGFLELDDAGYYRVHDLDHHAPDYVIKRRRREDARRTHVGQTADTEPPNGGQTADTRPPNGSTPTRSPARSPARSLKSESAADAARTRPDEPTREGQLWQAWLDTAHEHRHHPPRIASQRDWGHLKALTASYDDATLSTALAAWWASPHVTRRYLGQWRADLGDVLAAVESGRVYGAPVASARRSAEAQPASSRWVCPHDPPCQSPTWCQVVAARQEVSA